MSIIVRAVTGLQKLAKRLKEYGVKRQENKLRSCAEATDAAVDLLEWRHDSAEAIAKHLHNRAEQKYSEDTKRIEAQRRKAFDDLISLQGL